MSERGRITGLSTDTMESAFLMFGCMGIADWLVPPGGSANTGTLALLASVLLMLASTVFFCRFVWFGAKDLCRDIRRAKEWFARLRGETP